MTNCNSKSVDLSSYDACPLCEANSINSTNKIKFQELFWELMHCQTCNLYFTKPLPSISQIQKFYRGDYHSELLIPGETEKVWGPKYQRYLKWLQKFLPQGRVLDIGCATGLLVKMLCDHGYLAEGIELDKKCALWGAQYYNIKIYTDPIDKCPISKETLNAVILTDVLEHIQHPLKFLQEVNHLLVKGGIALITFPDISSIESRYFRFMATMLKRPWIWKNCHIPGHIWESNENTAKITFERAGFKIISFRRTQPPYKAGHGWKAELISYPTKILGIPVIDKYLGTQLEFIIQKTTSP